MRLLLVSLLCTILLASRAAIAQNIDMSTLPSRDTVQLTIYNSEDLTLVRETRHVTVKNGVTQLQFSWANTLIDASSVTIRLADRRLELVDTRYPHDRPQTLYWSIRSSYDGDATVEISYFTSGISWSADYVGVVNAAETTMAFDGFVTITNNSGEDYEGANVRMVVGTINLVEQIRQLAERGIIAKDVADQAAGAKHMRDMPEAARMELGRSILSAGSGGVMADASGMVKESLSEYFIFTVPGEETVKNGWSKRMRLFSQEGQQKDGGTVPFRTEYRYRPQEYGDQLVRLFLIRNDEASKLGESPLPDGAVRLFRQTGDGLSVLAFVSTKYVPIGQEFEFNLGRDPQVILERLVMEQSRDDFWFQSNNPQKLVSPTKGERIDPSYAVSGWNDRAKRVERVRNYRGAAITVAWRFGLDGDLLFRSSLNPTLFDFRTPEFSTTVNAGETKDLGYEVVAKQGSNAKQQHVTLEAAQ